MGVIDSGSISSVSASDSHVPSNSTPCLSSSSYDNQNNIIHTRALSDIYRNTSPIPFEGYSSTVNSQVDNDFSPSGTSSATVVVSSHKTSSKPTGNFIALPDEPKTIAQMLKSEHRHEWESAMAEEINSLQQNQTWTLETLPHGRTAVDNKWVFKIKTKSDGTVDHFKARLVAKGYSQTVGVDYGETYAPTAKMDSIRTLLALAAAEDSEMIQFDVKTAFLHGELSEELYMNLPTGYTIPNSAGKVCRLRKSLYGLKQASRVWNEKFTTFLKEHNLQQSTADPCIFFSDKEPRLITAIWVDDGLAICKSAQRLQAMIAYLKHHLEVTIGTDDMYIGLRISGDRSKRLLFVDQQRFIESLLLKFGYEDAHPVATPADSNVQLQAPQSDDDSSIPVFPYQELVGSLLYVQIATRPDITHAVNKVSQFSNNYRQIHCTAVSRIAKYLRGTSDFSLCYDGSEGSNVLKAYADADFAGDLDDRKSRSGCVILFNKAPILWLSRKQMCTATSTTESEYIAASLASKEIVWVRRLLADIGFAQRSPTLLLSDNQSAIRLIHNPEYHKRTKHIEIHYHVIREIQTRGEISTIYVPTEAQLADIFTKALTPEKFHRLRHDLNIVKKVQ